MLKTIYEVRITKKQLEALAEQFVTLKGITTTGENRFDDEGNLWVGYEEEE
jgi:hypothetical protein